jgi:hypothetical protein
VQAVGQLNEHHPDVVGHGEKQLAKILRLDDLTAHPIAATAVSIRGIGDGQVGKAKAAKFRYPFDEPSNLLAKFTVELLAGETSILDDVVKERRGDRGSIQVKLGKDEGCFDTMIDVRFATFAVLPLMSRGRSVVRSLDEIDADRRQVAADVMQETREKRLRLRPGRMRGSAARGQATVGRRQRQPAGLNGLATGGYPTGLKGFPAQRRLLAAFGQSILHHPVRGNGDDLVPCGIIPPHGSLDQSTGKQASVTPNERIVTVATLMVAGLGLSLLIQPPLAWGFVALLIATSCVGTDQVLRTHPRAGEAPGGMAILVLPALIVLAGALFLRLPFFQRGLAEAAGLVGSGVTLLAALFAEYQTLDQSGPGYRRARIVVTLIGYLIAFALFSAIFAPKFRSILSASAVLIASALISAELFRGSGRSDRQPLWIGVVALTLGEVTWALNYWVLSALAGGAVLLLVFYTVTGVIRSHLNGSLAPRVFSEHLIVAAVGLAAVMAGGLWLR